uniref:Uncharacterized protein n=1 Tax=Rhizophagus irregularis (strain DAOM 181602 / DAOM 197198 / MUCL 43194) TaxID=747089 RepID=U9TRV9_RHIID
MRGVSKNDNDHINRQNENQNQDAINPQLSETDRELLYKFRTEMNKLKVNLYDSSKFGHIIPNCQLGSNFFLVLHFLVIYFFRWLFEYNASDAPTVPTTSIY